MSLEFDKNNVLRRLGLERGGRAQKALDAAVIHYSQPFVPWATGSLWRSAFTATKIGSGEVVWPGPYAHYMWEGIVYGPNIPIFEENGETPTRFISPKGEKKHPTGKELEYTRDKNPLASDHWVVPMKAAYMKDIVSTVQKIVNEKK